MKRQEVKKLKYWIDLMNTEDVDNFAPLYTKYIEQHRTLSKEDQATVMQHGIEMIVLAKLLDQEIADVQRARPLWKKILNL